ncbi:hypothetical protein DVH24_026801, partial [Malus domestica]
KLSPLSDCINNISSTTTLANASFSQYSSSSTIKLKCQNPKLASITDYLLSTLDPKPSVVSPLITSTHPRPYPVLSSASGNFSTPFRFLRFSPWVRVYFCFVLVLISIWEYRVSDGRFVEVAEPAYFVHIYNTEAYYKVRQEIDFFGEISGVLMSPDDESLCIGIWD